MNLLVDKFISTTDGKISLKTLLTSDQDFQLQYAFDETQLAMLQMLSSLTTVLFKSTLSELKNLLNGGVSEEQYDEKLIGIELFLFEDKKFMRSKMPNKAKSFSASVLKLVSGFENSGTKDASGLFSEIKQVDVICADCTHALNYNLHMNIKGDCFGSSGATGIRGGGAISTLISGKNLKTTILANAIAVDLFDAKREIKELNNHFMWQEPPTGKIYFAHHIGLFRGLFAMAYHIDFPVLDEPCICDVCGHPSEQSVKEFLRLKYKGHYGATKNGRDGGAQWWPHPFTPTIKTEEGISPVCARDQYWQSWQDFSAYVVGKETKKSLTRPAFVVEQYLLLGLGHAHLLVGGNIAKKASITGRVYDLYAMPDSWKNKNLERVTKVIDAGLTVKDQLSQALNKMFGSDTNYDAKFVSGIKQAAIHQYTSNAQQIVQQILLDVDRKEARDLRKQAIEQLKNEAKVIYQRVMHKYQYDLPLFKALVKGELVLLKIIQD